MPKWFQHGANIDTKTHQQSMPKLVTERISKIIKNHVSLNGKIIEIHYKNFCFNGLEGCMCERERYQQNIKNPIIPKPLKNLYTNHARKGGSQKMKNHQTSGPKRR